MIDIRRFVKQASKQSKILLGGLTPSALQGRFIAPKVLVNSIPKSGTNLLQELVLLIPQMRGQITSVLHLDNGAESLVQKLTRLKPGLCAPGHIAYAAEIELALQTQNIRHIFIVRDFRDVIYSNISYLARGHISHPHNQLFANLANLDAKIQACLTGHESLGIQAWPVLIHQYRGWLNAKDILLVRYENLVSADAKVAEAEIARILEYLNLGTTIDLSMLRKKMFNPKGLTYNAPGINKWKHNFNAQQIALLNQVLGEELAFFGYSV